MGLFRSTKLFCDVAPYSDTVANSLMDMKLMGLNYLQEIGIFQLRKEICLRRF